MREITDGCMIVPRVVSTGVDVNENPLAPLIYMVEATVLRREM